MPRRTDTVVEDTAVNSPLRRSSRISVNSPAPITRTRRLSEPPENAPNNEKSNARGRRGSSVTKEVEEKTELPKTRSRRNSTSSETTNENDNKPAVTRSRRSSITTENSIDTTGTVDTPRKLRTRRGSIQEEKAEEPSQKLSQRRKSFNEDNENLVTKVSRGRRKSVEQSEGNVEQEVTEQNTRTQRSSTNKEESQEKSVIKPKRRLSITEKEPLKAELDLSIINESEEQEDVVNRKSTSPIKTKLIEHDTSDKISITRSTSSQGTEEKEIVEKSGSPNSKLVIVVDKLSPSTLTENKDLPQDKQAINVSMKESTDSELTVVNVDEIEKQAKGDKSDNDSTTAGDITKPSPARTFRRKSRLVKLESVSRNILLDDKLAKSVPENKTSITNDENESSKSVVKPVVTIEVRPPIDKEHTVDLTNEDVVPEELSPVKVDQEEEDSVFDEQLEKSVPENKMAVTHVINENESSLQIPKAVVKSVVTLEVHPQIGEEHTVSLTNDDLVPEQLSPVRKSPRISRVSQRAVSPKHIDFDNDPQLTVEQEEEDAVFVETEGSNLNDKKEKIGSTISDGSDGSFKFHLNTSLSKTESQSTQDDLETSNLNSSIKSNSSDKENVPMNDAKSVINSTSLKSDHVVARISNVFRPKNIDYSFAEPMEIDSEKSMLNYSSMKPADLDETNVKLSTTMSVEESEETVNDSFQLNLSETIIQDDEKVDVKNNLSTEVIEDEDDANKTKVSESKEDSKPLIDSTDTMQNCESMSENSTNNETIVTEEETQPQDIKDEITEDKGQAPTENGSIIDLSVDDIKTETQHKSLNESVTLVQEKEDSIQQSYDLELQKPSADSTQSDIKTSTKVEKNCEEYGYGEICEDNKTTADTIQEDGISSSENVLCAEIIKKVDENEILESVEKVMPDSCTANTSSLTEDSQKLESSNEMIEINNSLDIADNKDIAIEKMNSTDDLKDNKQEINEDIKANETELQESNSNISKNDNDLTTNCKQEIVVEHQEDNILEGNEKLDNEKIIENLNFTGNSKICEENKSTQGIRLDISTIDDKPIHGDHSEDKNIVPVFEDKLEQNQPENKDVTVDKNSLEPLKVAKSNNIDREREIVVEHYEVILTNTTDERETSKQRKKATVENEIPDNKCDNETLTDDEIVLTKKKKKEHKKPDHVEVTDTECNKELVVKLQECNAENDPQNKESIDKHERTLESEEFKPITLSKSNKQKMSTEMKKEQKSILVKETAKSEGNEILPSGNKDATIKKRIKNKKLHKVDEQKSENDLHEETIESEEIKPATLLKLNKSKKTKEMKKEQSILVKEGAVTEGNEILPSSNKDATIKKRIKNKKVDKLDEQKSENDLHEESSENKETTIESEEIKPVTLLKLNKSKKTKETKKEQKNTVKDDTVSEDIEFSSSGNNDAKLKKDTKDQKFAKTDELKNDITTINLKLDKYLQQKMSELENSGDEISVEDGDEEENDYIISMAEEGEEDTPSEDSNQIIDEGESINTTESEQDTDDDSYDDEDSFICDDSVDNQLLSGDEYDLEDTAKNVKKSRVINVEKYDTDVIKIPKKVKPFVEKKKSRIIQIYSSSEEEDQNALADGSTVNIDDNKRKMNLKSNTVEAEGLKNKKKQKSSLKKIKNKDPQEVFEENQSSLIDQSIKDESAKSSNSFKLDDSGCVKSVTVKKNVAPEEVPSRRSSITIHENIKVCEIQDSPLRDRINLLVDSFCSNMHKGDISMNLALEYQGKSSESTSESVFEESKSSKRKKNKAKMSKKHQRSVSETQGSSPKRRKLSQSTEDIQITWNEEQQQRKCKRKSESIESLSNQEISKKKRRKHKKSKVILNEDYKSPSVEELRTETFNLMDQLITDVKNRPVREVKPSTSKTDLSSSWIVETVSRVKPSTSIVSKQEVERFKFKKIHPKDFRSQMLYDPARVRRIETKKLLAKKGAYS